MYRTTDYLPYFSKHITYIMLRRRRIPLPARYRSRIQTSSYVYGFFVVLIAVMWYMWTSADAQQENTLQQKIAASGLTNTAQYLCDNFATITKEKKLTKVQYAKLQAFYKTTCIKSTYHTSGGGSAVMSTDRTLWTGVDIIQKSGAVQPVSMQVAGTNLVTETQKIYGQQIAVDIAVDTILRRPKRMQVKQDFFLEDTTKTRVRINKDTVIAPAKDEAIDPTALILTPKSTNPDAKEFMFGIENQHLIFSQPVRIELPVEWYVDGKQIPIMVKHAGDKEYNTRWLSVSADTNCTSTWGTTKPSSLATVQNGKAVFYTCGASYFMAGYTWWNNAANYTDNAIKNFTTNVVTGTNMPIGTRIKQASIVVDWQGIAGSNPAAPWAWNCYPREKWYSIIGPNGYSAILVKTWSMVWSQSNCPRSVYTFVMTGITAHPTTILSAGTYRVATWSVGLTWLVNRSPFGTWTLRVQDTAWGDGIILWWFKIHITGNVAPSAFALSNSSIVEWLATNTLIGNLSSSDVDTGDVFTYSFDTTCTGSYNNAQFTLSGNQLRSAVSFDYAVQTWARVCLRAADQRWDFITWARNISIIMTWFVKEFAPTSLPFPAIGASLSAQTLDYIFSWAWQRFTIQDTKWADTWYTTTLQMSGNLVAPGGYTIANTNIWIIGTPAVFLVSGVANTNVQPTTASSTPFRPLSSAQSLIRRNNGPNFVRRWTYGVNVPLRINVPAAQPVWNYQGTLVYTLIEN